MTWFTNQSKPTLAGVRRVRETVLTVGAIAGLVCIVATVAGLLFDVKPLIFRSGSMSPEITTGALALARTVPVSDLAVGDIVSVENPEGSRITHRVFEIQPDSDGTAIVTLKGDANDAPDIQPYAISEADRVFWSAGRLGYVAAWLSSSTATFLGGMLVGVVLMLVIRPPTRDETAQPDTTAPATDTSHEGRTQSL